MSLHMSNICKSTLVAPLDLERPPKHDIIFLVEQLWGWQTVISADVQSERAGGITVKSIHAVTERCWWKLFSLACLKLRAKTTGQKVWKWRRFLFILRRCDGSLETHNSPAADILDSILASLAGIWCTFPQSRECNFPVWQMDTKNCVYDQTPS